MTRPLVLGGSLAILAAGCASDAAADRPVYDVCERAAVSAIPPLRAPAPGGAAPAREPVPEQQVAEWLDEHYGAPAPEAVPRVRRVRIRYVPAKERVRERVVEVERDSGGWWWPPIALSLGWWHGGRGHHGWSWGLGWRSGDWCW